MMHFLRKIFYWFVLFKSRDSFSHVFLGLLKCKLNLQSYGTCYYLLYLHKASDSGNIRHGKMSGPDQVNQVAGQTGFGSKRIILSELKTGLGQSGCGSGQVDPYFSHEFFFFKENNMYLPFRKSCNKLLDVKCITLNSPLISRMNYTY